MTMPAARHGTIGPMAFLGIDEKMRNFASVSADLDVASVRFDMILGECSILFNRITYVQRTYHNIACSGVGNFGAGKRVGAGVGSDANAGIRGHAIGQGLGCRG